MAELTGKSETKLPLWQPAKNTTKIGIVAGVTIVTLGIHTGWLVEPFFGHVHWLHSIHGRFCYIPIIIAAAWFGVRGALLAATAITVGVIPYLLGTELAPGRLADEITEIIFYYALALLAGWLVDREFRARRRAQEMRLQLERSQKMSLVGSIATGMAHEIKNPLASIKGAVEILSDDSTAASDRDEFKAIVFKEVKRINSSVTDFLEFARPSETKLEVINLTEVVSATIKQIQAQSGKRGLTIEKEIDEDVMVMADAEKIHQVLLNLMLNAIDASEPDSTIAVRLSSITASGEARVVVEDTGSGISGENTERIFEPFFTTKSSGTGLGLSIAKNIVEQHGGTISLKNREPHGVEATIVLPLHQEETAA